MTIVANMGVSCIDDMNDDDASERDSFSRECYQTLPSPPPPSPSDLREPGNKAMLTKCEWS